MVEMLKKDKHTKSKLEVRVIALNRNIHQSGPVYKHIIIFVAIRRWELGIVYCIAIIIVIFVKWALYTCGC